MDDVFERFIKSYATREKSEDFSNWLASRLKQELPDMSEETSQKLSTEIIEAVAAYDNALGGLNKAVETGQSKEAWLARQITDTYEDMPMNESGAMLQQIENSLYISNADILQKITGVQQGYVIDGEGEYVEWNEYNIKDTAINIGYQAVISGLVTAATVMKMNMERGAKPSLDSITSQALQAGIKTASIEIKSVVAGAIKTASEQGLTELLPADTPVEVIGDMAGVAVESADALMNAATGKITITEALDKTGRASVAAACRYSANALKLKMTVFFGPAVTCFAGGLIDHMNSPQFSNNVYTVVRDAAVATWDGIKERGRNLFNNLKNSVKATLLN